MAEPPTAGSRNLDVVGTDAETRRGLLYGRLPTCSGAHSRLYLPLLEPASSARDSRSSDLVVASVRALVLWRTRAWRSLGRYSPSPAAHAADARGDR